jgi:uncharacterized protein (DUF486 family)
MLDFVRKLIEWLSEKGTKIAKIIFPARLRTWYYNLPLHFRYLINWLVLHGGVIALFAIVFALPGILGLGQPSQRIGALIGWGMGFLFYLLKETFEMLGSNDTSPWWDHIGDSFGAGLTTGLIPVLVLYN